MIHDTIQTELNAYLRNLMSLPFAFLHDSVKHILGNMYISKATVSDGPQQEIVCKEVWLHFVL